jgi:hypothetical protein
MPEVQAKITERIFSWPAGCPLSLQKLAGECSQPGRKTWNPQENARFIRIWGGSAIAPANLASERNPPATWTTGLFQNPDRLTELVPGAILLLQSAANFIH